MTSDNIMEGYYEQKYKKYKNKYLEEKDKKQKQKQVGGAIVAIDGTNYSGAGILLFSKHKNSSSKDEISVLLMEDKSGENQDFGGNIDSKEASTPNDALYLTASKELFEESQGLINMHPEFLRSYADKIKKSKDSGTDQYACFYVFISDNAIDVAEYKKNNNILSSKSIDGFNESNSINKFYISDIINELHKPDTIMCNDVDSNNKKIYGRTKGCIRLALSSILGCMNRNDLIPKLNAGKLDANEINLVVDYMGKQPKIQASKTTTGTYLHNVKSQIDNSALYFLKEKHKDLYSLNLNSYLFGYSDTFP